MTASLHARRHHHATTEAGLWLVWITARVTGLSTPLGYLTARLARVARVARHPAARAAAAWCARRSRAAAAASHAAAHRVLLRAELAAADLLTGPAPLLLDTATARLRRRAGWLALAGAVLGNLTYLALR